LAPVYGASLVGAVEVMGLLVQAISFPGLMAIHAENLSHNSDDSQECRRSSWSMLSNPGHPNRQRVEVVS
jgi:hypothetical protein